ncbi:MAG: methionine--tRNA ligase [Candidatus Nanoarchaeia archaeon]
MSATKKKIYITTAIDYVNSLPHIGHAYQKIAADCHARWLKSLGEKVFFQTGTDEHGLKILRAAEAAGKEPQAFVDEISVKFENAWRALNIDFDQFYRTTCLKHKTGVQKFIKQISKDIYKGKYKGYYCVGCEAYLSDADIVEGMCKIHKKPVEYMEEEAYFFRLSKYAGQLLDFYKQNPDFIKPRAKIEEVRQKILREGLKDLSITRSRFKWGIPFPLEQEFVCYVWFDALLNYLTGTGWPSKSYTKIWPPDYQYFGADNLWFHAVIWPAMLMSAGLPLPKQLVVNGWIMVEGQKISKSLGNVIDPNFLVQKFGADSVRYCLLRSAPFGEDLDFKFSDILTRHNSELVDGLGNLVARVLTLLEKFSAKKIPKPKRYKLEEIEVAVEGERTLKKAKEAMQNLDFHKALEAIWAYVHTLNKYIDTEKPWELAKENSPHLPTVLYNLAEGLRFVTALIWPFMPETATKLAAQLGQSKIPLLKNLCWGKLKSGTEIIKGEHLFNKISQAELEDPFSALDLKVAEILEVNDIPETDRLYKLRISLGKFGEREIVAGIKRAYKQEELKGKKIIVVANLKPAKIRGVLSQGMLLACEDKNSGQLGILTVSQTDPGADVFVEGVEKKPVQELSLDDFVKITLETKAGSVYYKNKPLQTYKEKIKIEKVSEGEIH